MTKESRKLDTAMRTLIEMIAGIVLFGIVCELAGVYFVDSKIYYSLGLWYGILIAVLMSWHMWRSIGRGLLMGEGGAPKYITTANMIRYLAVALFYIAICLLDFGSPIAAFVGIMGLKVTAYLQPLTHKCFKRLFGWEDEVFPLIPPEELDEMARKEKEENSL